MYQDTLYHFLSERIQKKNIHFESKNILSFFMRLSANYQEIAYLFDGLYHHHPNKDTCFATLTDLLLEHALSRQESLRDLDANKSGSIPWYVRSDITGMSLYVDRFAENLTGLSKKLPYLQELGINFVHLMPVMESPADASDGGYAVSDFRKVDSRFGTTEELEQLIRQMHENHMFVMLDIVLNHTSDQHIWAKKAAAGDAKYQEFYHMFDNREMPDAFEKTMPDIFPDSSPGSFTYNASLGKWVMTVFHSYQWDLNYSNPDVFVAMLDTILYYANLGVDILRIDAPAFIWKQLGTTCQNQPQAHTLLQLIKLCVQAVAPGMALLAEAIVAPSEIMRYFGTGHYLGKECDVAYNATQMALQWDALATGDVRVMMAAQSELLKKPLGTTWITYTRCHDDIGLGYDDTMITQAGFNPLAHRDFLKAYYTGIHPGSPSRGALFGVNPRTNDARISGSLASLCGLETALEKNDFEAISLAIRKIALMQAHSLFLGGIPMLFYGDECGYTNDPTYLHDPSKSYDNRWMHRPHINWEKNQLRNQPGTVESRIFDMTQKLIALRKNNALFSDLANIVWLPLHNVHIAGFRRFDENESIMCLFNFSSEKTGLTWFAFKQMGWKQGSKMKDLWSNEEWIIGPDYEHIELDPYQFVLLKLT